MSPYRTKRRWKEGTYMQVAMDRFKMFVYTQQDLDEYKNTGMIDPRKISQRALSRKSGVNQATISLLLRGKKKTCTPKTAQAISEAIGVDVTILFDPKEPIANHQAA